MKLRFRSNSLRLRVNQREVQSLAAGRVLAEHVVFPGDTCLEYMLSSEPNGSARVWFQNGSIQVFAPQKEIADWARGEEIGLYFDLPANGTTLKVAIEKDLECVDGPAEERDPEAFPRTGKNC
jgi:hypothetical protein